MKAVSSTSSCPTCTSNSPSSTIPPGVRGERRGWPRGTEFSPTSAPTVAAGELVIVPLTVYVQVDEARFEPVAAPRGRVQLVARLRLGRRLEDRHRRRGRHAHGTGRRDVRAAPVRASSALAVARGRYQFHETPHRLPGQRGWVDPYTHASRRRSEVTPLKEHPASGDRRRRAPPGSTLASSRAPATGTTSPSRATTSRSPTRAAPVPEAELWALF